ncbi:MAG: DUF1800 domain-containing protein [Blastocatellia bacterium]|nr:DUF1800 domain-containing protein [Blastocatellia bacterium]
MAVTWNTENAAHLLRRAGFAGSQAEVADLVKRGLEGSVDYLLNYESIDNSALENQLKSEFRFDPTELKSFSPSEVERFFIFRMTFTKRPLEEKMTFFWHDHFATGLSKVKDYFMYYQNLTLRKFALAKFDDLVLNVAKDPGMIIWLDNIDNVRGKPNENFARELMELFTCGVFDVVSGQPNYTEDDVKESARAFTGWTLQRQNFFFNQNLHDFGVKTFRGQTGNFNGEDIIANLCNDNATARFMAKKLWEYFVYPNPKADLIDRFAGVYFAKAHSIKELMRAILTSDEFYSDKAKFALVKNPVEFVVGLVRQLGGTGTLRLVAQSLSLQGQEVMDPPDVSGWTSGLGWVNTSSLLERYNFANDMLSNRSTSKERAIFVDVTKLLPPADKQSKADVVDFYLNLMGPLTVDNKTAKALQNYLALDDSGKKGKFKLDDATADKKIRGLLHLIASLPEYHLN